MTDNLDELKRQWQQLSQRTQNLEDANRKLSERMARSKVSSTQERLADRIWRWSFAGLSLPVLAPLLHETGLPWWFCGLYALYGIVFGYLWWDFANYIRSDRLTDMPVKAAIERAVSIRIRQQRIRACGFLLVITLFAAAGFMLPEESRTQTLVGGGIGFVTGLAIAIPRVVANERMAKSMVDTLREE